MTSSIPRLQALHCRLLKKANSSFSDPVTLHRLAVRLGRVAAALRELGATTEKPRTRIVASDVFAYAFAVVVIILMVWMVSSCWLKVYEKAQRVQAYRVFNSH